MRIRFLVGLALALALAEPSSAADWTVSRVAGTAQLHDGTGWRALAAGDGLGAGHILRTTGDGLVDLVLGTASINLSANAQLGVSAAAGRAAPLLHLDYGTVMVETATAPARPIELRTSLLALTAASATRFTLEETGSFSRVAVLGGNLAVADIAGTVVHPLGPDQTATMGLTGGLVIVEQAAPLGDAAPPSLPLRGALPLGGIGADPQDWSRIDGTNAAIVPAERAETAILPEILSGAILGGLLGGLGLAVYALGRRIRVALPKPPLPAARS